MEDDWDLHAVVRGFTSAATATAAAAAESTCYGQTLSTFEQDFEFSASWLQDLFEPRRDSVKTGELHDLYKPFIPKSQEPSRTTLFPPQNLQVNSPLSVLGQTLDIVQTKQQPFSVVNGSKASSSSHNPSPRSKKRKNHMKRVSHVPAESLSSDKWSWRKYGQKPIKGSPYPRGYYRCSTSKGCLARKQVERNRSDPGMFIVTYTGEHNHPMPTHRNSLAGSTRNKPAENPNSDEPAKKAPCSPEISPAVTFSPPLEKMDSSREDLPEAEDDDVDDDFSGSNMALDDDFFAGLEDFTGQNSGECLSDHIPASLQFPWLANSSATTAAGSS